MAVQLQQKSTTFIQDVRQCYAHCDETAEVRITRFSLEISTILNYLYIKFDDEI